MYQSLTTQPAYIAPNTAPCPLCGSHVGGDACTRCYAPRDVIQSILARDQAPRYVGVLGPSGVGKTVYLGMLLDLLAHGAAGLHGVARGTFSLTLHRNVMLALESQRFPEKTPSEPDRWHWVHCEVAGGRRKEPCVDLVTPDVAGEAVMAELERPGSNLTIRALLLRCAGMIVLIDTAEVVVGGQGQEMFAMQLVTYLDSLHVNRNRKVEVPVSLVFTKADLCEEPIDDPDAFARAHAPALWRLCQARLKHFRFFRSGIAGSCGRLVEPDGRECLVPLRVEPSGIIEPFAWLLSHIR
jgi:hypothetical protein